MRTRYARQIREGIKAARLPHRLRGLWILQNVLSPRPVLVQKAFDRTDTRLREQEKA